MSPDRYGLPLSIASPAARDAYIAGVDCILAATAGWTEHLRKAIELEPGFALAHIALARGEFVVSEIKPAREAAARARELAANATARERSHVHALALAIEGKPVDSLEATKAHLGEFPRDAMVLAPATGVFGLIGFSGRVQREAEMYELLRSVAPHYGNDWWFESMLAFAACEYGRLDEALALIERSMAANPRSAHGAHVKVHVLYEMGEMAKSLEYLERWMPGFDRRGLLHCHLSWHVALCALALGKLDRAWDAYRSSVHPGASWGPPINVVSDAASFLWRSELAGHARRPELWQQVSRYALESFPKAGVPFADVHTALACVANADGAALEKLVGEMRARLDAGKLPPGPVVPLLAEAFSAYASERWDLAIRKLEQALPETVRIGGSRAQRDLVETTLLAAYLKAGRAADARKLVAGRIERRPFMSLAGYPLSSA
jgi:tetratricopeptide (TPR) repeat protein